MARIDIKSSGTILADGILQLENGAAMDSTLRSVTDQNNTASQLKLASNATQVVGTLQITTNNNPYIDAEDGAGNNRFTVGRDSSSQQVNVDFASNPTSSTDAVGAIRTYANGVALSEAMTFLRNGNVGIGTNSPTDKLTLDGNLLLSTNGFLYKSTGGGAVTSGLYLDSSTPKASVYINSSERVIFGNSTAATIKGSGSTSATTSLLVQNSGGTEMFRIYDDSATYIWGGNVGGYTTNIQIGGRSNTANLSFYGDKNIFIGESGSGENNPSALLSMKSTTKGFLPPRMTTAEKNAIATPAAGLMIYDTTLARPCFYNGATWITL
jgi:hypothetical protein